MIENLLRAGRGCFLCVIARQPVAVPIFESRDSILSPSPLPLPPGKGRLGASACNRGFLPPQGGGACERGWGGKKALDG